MKVQLPPVFGQQVNGVVDGNAKGNAEDQQRAGLEGNPENPITAAVKMSGTRLGNRLMATIRALRNRMDITVAMTSTARASDTKRFLTK